MSRDLDDPRVVHVLETLAIWLHDDGETFEPTAVETLTEAMNLDQQRAEVVQAVAEAYVRTCNEHSLVHLEAWAARERRTKREIDLQHAAENALVALGIPLEEAEAAVSHLIDERDSQPTQEAAVQ